MTLEIDNNEPTALISAIAPSVDFYEVGPLNHNGHSDYIWRTGDGIYKEVERKTWPELLSSIDKVEEQLQRHLLDQPSAEHVLLIEGVAIGDQAGSRVLKQTKSGVFVKGQQYTARMSGVYSWLYEVGKYLEVIQTHCQDDTATALVAMYKADQKDEHTTLRRHIKMTDYNPDPVIQQFMNMIPSSGAFRGGIGEKRAIALRRHYNSVYDICNTSIEELIICDGIGRTVAKSLLIALGRTDV